MTTPQVKFFDTDSKEWLQSVKNIIGHLFLDEYLRVWLLFDGKAILQKNIIAVPFTGGFDINDKAAYLHDLVKKPGSNRIWKIIEYKSALVLNELDTNKTLLGFSTLLQAENFEIIGSSLTNPELLESK